MGVFSASASVLRKFGSVGEVPARAVEAYGHGLGAAERMMWTLVRARMDEVAPPQRPVRQLEPSRKPGPSRSAREMMAALLEDALEHDALRSEQEFYTAVVKQLLPDEARILQALADGSAVPTVSVYRRGSSDLLLDNASLVGRTAAVTLPSRTTKYVAHLLHLGLVELGPEDKDNGVGYELVLADREVRPALNEGALGKLPARVERKTLRLSEHGRALWEATRPGESS